MFRIFFLFLFLVGCGQVKSGYIDPEAQPYVERFKDLIGVYPVGTSISLVDDMSMDKAGNCYLTIYESTITINRKYWNLCGDYGKEQLVFHELGHCFLNYPHNERIFEDGCFASIMHPVHFGNTLCYAFHRSELFKSYKAESGL